MSRIGKQPIPLPAGRRAASVLAAKFSPTSTKIFGKARAFPFLVIVTRNAATFRGS